VHLLIVFLYSFCPLGQTALTFAALFTMGLFNMSKNKTNEEVAPVEPRTSATVDSEKGVDSKTPSETDHDHEGLSSNAQAGVKAVEAAATVWTKYHLIGAYVMYDSHMNPGVDSSMLTEIQHLVDLLRHRPPRSRHPCHESIRYQ
jgi:hypothetical protein